MLSEKQKTWEHDDGVMEAEIEKFVGPDLWRKLRSYIGDDVQVNDGLIATREAQNDPLLIQGDLDSVGDAPVGYGLAGFLGPRDQLVRLLLSDSNRQSAHFRPTSIRRCVYGQRSMPSRNQELPVGIA